MIVALVNMFVGIQENSAPPHALLILLLEPNFLSPDLFFLTEHCKQVQATILSLTVSLGLIEWCACLLAVWQSSFGGTSLWIRGKKATELGSNRASSKPRAYMGKPIFLPHTGLAILGILRQPLLKAVSKQLNLLGTSALAQGHVSHC